MIRLYILSLTVAETKLKVLYNSLDKSSNINKNYSD